MDAGGVSRLPFTLIPVDDLVVAVTVEVMAIVTT